MHDCTTIPVRLSLYLDHALSPTEASQLLVELEQCPDCQALYEVMVLADARLRATPVIAPARDLTPDILAHIDDRLARRQRLVGLTILLSGYLSLGLIMLAGVAAVVAAILALNPANLHLLVRLAVTLLTAVHTLAMALAVTDRKSVV